MEATAEIDYGKVKIEISGGGPEEVRRSVIETIEYMGDNREFIKTVDSGVRRSNLSSPKTEYEDESGDGGEMDDLSANTTLSPIADRLDLPASTLEQHLIVEDGRLPSLYLPDAKLLGDQKTDRQRRASLILLYIWEECLGEDRMKSTDLKEALMLSDIDETKMSNMYQGEGDRYFDRGGRGPSATVALTGPGRRRAFKIIEELMDRLDDPDDEDEVNVAEDKSILDY